MSFFEIFTTDVLKWIFFGAIWGHLCVKISNLKADLHYFKETRFKYIQDDVSDLTRDKYNKITRDELMIQTHCLSQRILIIETKMEEREKSKA